jgi:hypothetical protein
VASAAVIALLLFLLFCTFPLLPLGLSHRSNQVALHYPHFPPLASIIPHFSPLFYWTIFRAVAKPLKDKAKPPKDKAKPPQGKNMVEDPAEDLVECALDASYLRHERSQHVTGGRAT